MKARISLKMGNLLQILAICLGLLIALKADRIYFFLLSSAILWYFSHCLAHYIVGTIVGVRFKGYFITTSSIKKLKGFEMSKHFYTLGIKIDWKKSKAGKLGFALMFSSGAIASMFSPFLTVLIAYLRDFKFESTVLALVWILNAIFTIYFSPKVGDFRKAIEILER